MATETFAFERSHDIVIAAPAATVLDYVGNPRSWPEWLAASHDIDSADRPLAAGDAFNEKWRTRKGEVTLAWTVTAAERGRLWIAETWAAFTGPIIVEYRCEPVDGGVRYTRRVINPARPKLPTPEMIARMDEEAAAGLANIKRIVEGRTGK